MPEKKSLRVLIVGGGIGGITAALALRPRGIDALILEQARAFTQVGAGIQLSANATRVLRRLGLGEPLGRVSVYPEARDYRAWDTGERLYLTPLGAPAEARFGAPYYQLLGAAGQPELAALYARTRTPAAPPPDHRRASRQQPDCLTSSGDTGLDGDVEVDVEGSNDR